MTVCTALEEFIADCFAELSGVENRIKEVRLVT